MSSVFVFVPAFGWQLATHTALSTHALMPALSRAGIGSGIAMMSHPDIADLRNVALSIWYQQLKEHSHILFVDADMGFDAQMVLDMLAFGEPVVGAIYRKKSEDVQWAVSGLGPDTVPEARGAFVEVEGLGFGVMLLRRDAIDAMVKAYPDLVTPTANHNLRGLVQGCENFLRFFDPIEAENGQGRVSEDISFCRRWRATGGKVWGASHHVTHFGPYAYGGSYADWSAQQMQKQAVQSSAA